MSTPILSTKLYIPSPRHQIVRRPRLIERLNRGRYGKLTLVSAPAGFGKTILLTAWVAGSKQPVAWLSLDENDSDLARFLTYLIAALRTLAGHPIDEMVVGIPPDFGASALAALDSAQPPPPESILTALLNELAAVPEEFVLVLDDYHVLDGRVIDEALAFLLEHLPPQMHLVIASREDPALPLARYRARGNLAELRAADLRFTADEAADFLNHMMGLDLSAKGHNRNIFGKLQVQRRTEAVAKARALGLMQ